MSWFEEITRGWARPGRDDAAPTPSTHWTVSGTGFATTGWTLVDSSPTSMSWSSRTRFSRRHPSCGSGIADAGINWRVRTERAGPPSGACRSDILVRGQDRQERRLPMFGKNRAVPLSPCSGCHVTADDKPS